MPLTNLAAAGPALIVAPHPDDEVLGVGGTMARLADEGAEVHVTVLTAGRPPRFDARQVSTVRTEAGDAHRILGVTETHWLDLPAAALDTVSHAEANDSLGTLVRRIDPATIFLPHPGDIHLDHQLAFLSAMVAARPHQTRFPTAVLAYETLSETNWNAPYLTPAFLPNCFVDISASIDRKLAAFRQFASQHRAPPHERSVETIRALATLRGATVHRPAAEAFVNIRLLL